MGPYDEETGRNLNNDDVQYALNNGGLTRSSLDENTYYDGDGVEYDSEYNRK